MYQATPPDHDNGKPVQSEEILDLLDLLVEIALAQIVANNAEQQQHETEEAP